VRRPDLRAIPLRDALAGAFAPLPTACVITMSEGQWDAVLAAAYRDGWILVELDANEVPLRAYQKVIES
jgi:hypothetical protein